MQVDDGRVEHIEGRVYDEDAATLQLRGVVRIEQQGPTVGNVSAQARAHLVDVVTETRGRPHVGDGMQITGIVNRHATQDLRVEVDEIGQCLLVELAVNT